VSPRILLVNDDPALAGIVDEALAAEGWSVRSAGSAESAVEAAGCFHPDIVVLDMVLPDGDGLQAMRQLRRQEPDLPILFLSALAGVDDRVRALSAGGDDYVVKPFSVRELVSRLRALLRRTRPTDPKSSLTVADLTLHEHTRQVHRAGRRLDLTVTEFDLLRYLMLNSGRVLPTEQIRERVWQFDLDAHSRAVEIYVARLRRKIEKDHPPLIHTVRGIGYIFESRPRDE
jgi:two-component system, OmpR family, response regulator